MPGICIGAGGSRRRLAPRHDGGLADHGEAGNDVVPDTLRGALASEHDSARVAKQWHDTDEMRHWDAEEVLEVVKGLRR
jgi:hypothetical protein